jgi:hypothetical protein
MFRGPEFTSDVLVPLRNLEVVREVNDVARGRFRQVSSMW